MQLSRTADSKRNPPSARLAVVPRAAWANPSEQPVAAKGEDLVGTCGCKAAKEPISRQNRITTLAQVKAHQGALRGTQV
jgi:hypothetical protein